MRKIIGADMAKELEWQCLGLGCGVGECATNNGGSGLVLLLPLTGTAASLPAGYLDCAQLAE